MSSIYQDAMGADFKRLHPKIQERFGFSSEDRVAAIGRGVMDRMWRGKWYTLPGLYLGAWRNIMFPEQGRDVPFTIENYAYVDQHGRETVTWLRTFDIGKRRRFDAYMVPSDTPGRVVDYLGTHQHLSVDLDLSVSDRGGLRILSGAQRMYIGPFGFRFPMLFSGVADVCEWYDDDRKTYRIDVNVSNRWMGGLFGYNGSFQVDWLKVTPAHVPERVFPKREERRP